MKKRRLLFALAATSLLLVANGCGKSTTTSLISEQTTTTTAFEKVCTGIEAYNVDNEKVYVGHGYVTPSYLVVYAYYNDGTYTNVTSEISASKITTTTPGERTVHLYYGSFETSYKVNVLQNNASYIELDTTNCKILYYVNETFSSENLVVNTYYEDGTSKIVNDYTLEVNDSDNEAISINNPFTKTGKYDVTISYLGEKQYYGVYVIDELGSDYNYNPSYSVPELSMENDVYTFNGDNKVIFEGPYLNINCSGSRASLSKLNTPISYKNNTFDYGISIAHEENTYFAFGIEQKCKIRLLCKSFGSLALVKQNNDTDIEGITYYGNPNVLGEIYFEVGPGVYYLYSYNGQTEIYNMILNFDESVSYSKFDYIRANTNAVKKEYGLGEVLDLTGLNVMGVTNETSDVISGSDLNIYLIYDNHFVTSFVEEGTYKVLIKYNGDKLCYDKYDSFNVNYSINLEESMYLKTLKVEEEAINLQIGTFEYRYTTNLDSINLFVESYKDEQNSIFVNGEKIENTTSVNLIDGENEIRIVVENGFENKTAYVLYVTKN